VVAFDERTLAAIEDILVAFRTKSGGDVAAPSEPGVRKIEAGSRVSVEAAKRKHDPKAWHASCNACGSSTERIPCRKGQMMPPNVLSPFKILASAVVITQLAACSTTYVSSLWKDPTYQVKPHKIMIIGIAKSPANKRTLEDDFAEQLKLRARMPLSSYAILPDDKDGNKDAIAAKMKEQGADAVLITRIASRKTVYTNLLGVYAPAAILSHLAELLRVWL